MSAALALVVLVVCSGKDNPSSGGGGTTGGTVTGDSTGTGGDVDTIDVEVDTTGGEIDTTGGDGQVKTYTLLTVVSPAEGGWVALNPSQLRYDSGTRVTVTATPKDGYAFIGWSGASTSTNRALLITMNANKELTANFQENLYAVTVEETPGGKVVRNPDQTNYSKGTQVTLTAVPDEGYFFAGWGPGQVNKNNPYIITVDGDYKYTANFVQGYKLNVSVDDDIRGTVSVNSAQPANGYPPWSSVTVTATPKTGYKFAGWSGASSSKNNILNVSMDGNISLKANFEPTVEYKLTLDVSPKSWGTVNLVSGAPHYHGTTAVVSAQPADGYGFVEWSGASTSTSATTSIIMDGNKTLTANFARVYTLTTLVDPPGYGTVRRSPDQKSYFEGTKVTLTPSGKSPDDSYYRFVGWEGEPSYPQQPTITMDGNKTLTAKFERLCLLTINIKPDYSGTVSGSPAAKAYYSEGANVTLTATPNTGYKFVGWSGASTSTSDTVTITIVGGDNTLTANFEPQ